MCKFKTSENMKKQANNSPHKIHNPPQKEPTHIEGDKIPGKDYLKSDY